ncbi:MAG: NF038122 family metalloprotease [Cyanobacteria bacterium P01_D01_bin.50]
MNGKRLVFYLTNKISHTLGKITFTVATLLCSNLPAQAANFNFTYSPGITDEQKSAVEMAGQVWSNRIEDDITVNLHIEMTDASKLPTNTIGGALPAFLSDTNYGDFYNNLVSDRRSANDETATNSLFSEGQVNKWTSNGGGAQGKLESNKINLTTANAKAVGLIDQHHTGLDGVILLSDLSNHDVDWQYDYLSPDVGADKLDFTSVVIHEIGHVLGFVSALDAINSDNHRNGLVATTVGGTSVGDATDRDNRQKHFSSLDLFRYLEPETSEGTTYSFEDGEFVLEEEEIIITRKALSYGQESIFSIDGGITELAEFSTGQDITVCDWTLVSDDSDDVFAEFSTVYHCGDGFQGSHWKHQNPVLGIMDPVLAVNERRSITQLDLTALDVIGYDIKGTQISLSNLQSQANAIAENKTGFWRHSDIQNMLNQYGWGGGSGGGNGGGNGGGGGFGQEMHLADFLAQGGWFQKGTFFSHMPTEMVSVPEPTSIVGLLGFGLLGLGLRQKRKSN